MADHMSSEHLIGCVGMRTHIDRGIFPPPVRLSRRFVVFPSDEVRRIINARVAGHDDDAIRALVLELIEARKSRV
jgi:hypothetical protein